MNVTIINDCRDANAAGRQVIRVASLLAGTVSFVGVASDLEASGNLIDALDAYGDAPGVILVNVAPRNGVVPNHSVILQEVVGSFDQRVRSGRRELRKTLPDSFSSEAKKSICKVYSSCKEKMSYNLNSTRRVKKWKNGAPFGYFWHKNVLVVASIDGLTLSLVKKLHLVDTVHVLDIPTVVDTFVDQRMVTREMADYIIDTQFRSYEFLPRVAAYLWKYREVANEALRIGDIADVSAVVWWVDNFGNCKTSVLGREIAGKTEVQTAFGTFPHIPMLKDVPDGMAAATIGSSGLGADRFVEIVVQGKSAAEQLGISSGDALF